MSKSPIARAWPHVNRLNFLTTGLVILIFGAVLTDFISSSFQPMGKQIIKDVNNKAMVLELIVNSANVWLKISQIVPKNRITLTCFKRTEPDCTRPAIFRYFIYIFGNAGINMAFMGSTFSSDR
ncbi:hypothetical protein OUZ56_030067 [Daphnia magna]|uniref:Uncharacterized protein n=1 Tax=Daphnia magna TaxID=35525 RepID=A0ABQ9ZQ73_9CRUS|nr:hypothetical protein OUZ56_030067 [Daphnia magna]